MPLYDFDAPQRFVAGTVGPPGERAFFLQARQGSRVLAVSLEKEQVAVLADRIHDILDEAAGGAASERAAEIFQDDDPLETPVEDEFRVMTISLQWDSSREAVIVECLDHDPDEAELVEDDPVVAVPGSSRLRVILLPAQARAFARRAQRVVAAGRPPCPFCGGPLDPQGHICPRSNGYRR